MDRARNLILADQTQTWLRNAKHAHFVRIHLVQDWLSCGWLPTNALEGTPHGEWSVLMKGIDCQCRKLPRTPRPMSKSSPSVSYRNQEPGSATCPLWLAASTMSGSAHEQRCSRLSRAQQRA